MDTSDDLDRQLRALGIDPHDIPAAVLDALRDAKQPDDPQPAGDDARTTP
jgi:hypothetical protein